MNLEQQEVRLGRWLARVEDEFVADGARQRLLRWAAYLLLAAALAACVPVGANRPKDPRLVDPSAVEQGSPSRLAPFTEVGIRLDGASHCVLLADTETERARGLMDVAPSALDGYAGMLFRFEGDTTGEFYMRRTRFPLSIGFFAADGRFVAARDMVPCPDTVQRCPTYGTGGTPYRYALEVPAGRLGALGATPGAVLAVTGACA